jgi:hypothetical protein
MSLFVIKLPQVNAGRHLQSVALQCHMAQAGYDEGW